MSRKHDNDGFIALMTAIILVTVLILASVSLNSAGYLIRGGILENEYRERAYALASACIETARLYLAKENTYAGNENISVNGETCAIRPITDLGTQYRIEASASFRDTEAHLRVIVNDGDFGVVSWEDVPAF